MDSQAKAAIITGVFSIIAVLVGFSITHYDINMFLKNEDDNTNPGVQIYSDNFTNNGNGWDLSYGDGLTRSIKNGKLILTLCKMNKSFLTPVPNLKDFMSNFTIEVEATSDQSDECQYGLTLRRADEDHAYCFLISNTGYYSFYKYKDSKWIEIINPAFSNDIKVGQQTNKIKAICKGNDFTFYVNDIMLATCSDSDYPQGALGIQISAPYNPNCISISFENLKIWKMN